jgi:hypothetical protein
MRLRQSHTWNLVCSVTQQLRKFSRPSDTRETATIIRDSHDISRSNIDRWQAYKSHTIPWICNLPARVEQLQCFAIGVRACDSRDEICAILTKWRDPRRLPAASLTRSHDSNSVLDSICDFLSEVSYNYKFPPISLIISNTLLAYIQMFLGSKNRLDFSPTFRLKFALRVRISFSSSSSSRIVSRVRFTHRLRS